MPGNALAMGCSRLPSPLDWQFASDGTFSEHLDDLVAKLGIQPLKSPRRCPKANGICKSVIGAISRECLDSLMPLPESHLRAIFRKWSPRYNQGAPHGVGSSCSGSSHPPMPTTRRNSLSEILVVQERPDFRVACFQLGPGLLQELPKDRVRFSSHHHPSKMPLLVERVVKHE